jgi:subtilisin-like proprotein convertase family protein
LGAKEISINSNSDSAAVASVSVHQKLNRIIMTIAVTVTQNHTYIGEILV